MAEVCLPSRAERGHGFLKIRGNTFAHEVNRERPLINLLQCSTLINMLLARAQA